MKKITLVLCLTLLAVTGAALAQDPGGSGAATAPAAPVAAEWKAVSPDTAAGTALLDMFLDTMRGMTGKGTAEYAETRLQKMRAAADKARAEKAVDAVFFSRYNRMLAITKLVATPDPGGILGPFIDAMLGDFVEEKLGHPGFRDEGGKGPKAINYVAQSLAEEVIDLQIYLDTIGRRQALKKAIEDRLTAPEPK